MPSTPPQSTKDSLAQRLAAHARPAWPQLTDLHIRQRGAFAYIDGELADGEIPKLMRYAGSASSWGFAPYYASSDREDSILPADGVAGTPDDALDCASQLHLASPGL
ncbi:hypothetical protein ABZ826_39095 [Streptomyces sp. NPDC047515]|uniref:hypothetical protein n=1 Tax=Streptomyces sp. NPDC047515 TaxID=3155380 RepID=UPI0033FFCA31